MAAITSRGETEMKSVYDRKRPAANVDVRETWMDRFTQLEPEGGFRTVVKQAWNQSASTPNGAGHLNSLNGRLEIRPVYGQIFLSANAGARETWMVRFTQSEPEGGFRATVEWAWSSNAPTSDEHPKSQAA